MSQSDVAIKDNRTTYKLDFMPKDAASIKILSDRAIKLASLKTEKSASKTFVNYIKFSLVENSFYGIQFQYIKEILQSTTITPMPFTPNFISGIINYRGSIITVFNLAAYLGLATTPSQPNYLIIITTNACTIALAADRIFDSSEYESNTLVTPSSFGNVIKGEYILGLDQGNIVILNMQTLMNDIKEQLAQNKLK